MPQYKLDILVTARDTASGVLGGLGKTLGGFGAAAAGAVAVVGAAVGAVAVKVGIDSVKLATSFQSQMSILAIAAAGAGESFDTLHDAALAVGGDISLVGVSAVGAGDAMTGLYKAGLTTTEIFGDLKGYMAGTAELGGALRASIDLAAASELDMVQASDLAAIALATFGGELKTEEERAAFVNKAMNNMVQAADASVASVSDLAEGMRNIGSTAAAFGYKFEDVNNALALLSTRGIQGAEAGTALNSMLTNMMRDTKDVKTLWSSLGISLYDATGKMRTLPQIIGDLSGAMAGMTEEQRNATVQTLAGTYGMKAMNTLMAEGVEGWDAMAAATANAAGIQAQAAARANTLAGAQEALKGAFETLKIQVGEALLPALTELTRWATGMIDTYGPQVTEAVNAIVGVFTDLASGKFDLTSLIPPEVLDVVAHFQELLGTLGAWWDEYGPGIQAKATEMFGLIQEAGAQLADKVLPWISEQLDKFGAWFAENGPLIADFADVMMEAFTRIWQEVVAAWAWIEPILTLLIDVILGIAKAIMEMATGDWTAAWQTIQDTAAAAWVTIQKAWVAFADWVTGWFGSTWAEVVNQWRVNWELFSTIVGTAWDRITGAIQDAVGKIKGWIQSVIDKFNAVHLPGWLTGHSPPPLANWITDIGEAMNTAARASFPDLNGMVRITQSIGTAMSPLAYAGGTRGSAAMPSYAPAGGGSAGPTTYIIVQGDIWSSSKVREIVDLIAENDRRRGRPAY